MKWETKRAIILAVIGLIVIGTLAFALSGCSLSAGGNGDTYSGSSLRVSTVEVDGRDVTCVVYVGNGVSCDW